MANAQERAIDHIIWPPHGSADIPIIRSRRGSPMLKPNDVAPVVARGFKEAMIEVADDAGNVVQSFKCKIAP